MFHWYKGDIYVVLTDAEVSALVQQLSESALSAMQYEISPMVRRECEKKIFAHLDNLLRSNWEEFHRRYHFRSCYGRDAEEMLPIMLDGYARTTKRAIWGEWENCRHGKLVPHSDSKPRMSADTLLANTNFSVITLLGRGRWPWSGPLVTAYVRFDQHTIEKLAGTVTNFFVANHKLRVKFAPDGVFVQELVGKGLRTRDVSEDEAARQDDEDESNEDEADPK